MDTNELANLQLVTNQNIYDAIVDQYQELSKQCGSQDSVNIIVSSVATNLGIILAQVPDNYRQKYLELSKQIIDKSLTQATEDLVEEVWGQIGHA